ncbi:MAG TPA: hypothetical protein VK045_15040 [Ornithinicoccus sp.]|nr:hypothetical protein [Ornithinicoccus sp.]
MQIIDMNSLRVETDHRRDQLTRAWQRPPSGRTLRLRLRETWARLLERATIGRTVESAEAGLPAAAGSETSQSFQTVTPDCP